MERRTSFFVVKLYFFNGMLYEKTKGGQLEISNQRRRNEVFRLSAREKAS